MTDPEAEWTSQQNILIFIFSYFTTFVVPLADTISAEPSPESLQLGALCVCRGVRHSEYAHSQHSIYKFSK